MKMEKQKPMRMKIEHNATRDRIDILMYSSIFTHFQVWSNSTYNVSCYYKHFLILKILHI